MSFLFIAEAKPTEDPCNGTTTAVNATTKRPELIMDNFVKVYGNFYLVARNDCIEKGAVPFVPKSAVRINT
ncbi:UNVERIFIED_CONTAM: hypothetical protein RMT77_018845 [Armadillidium vulgare]